MRARPYIGTFCSEGWIEAEADVAPPQAGSMPLLAQLLPLLLILLLQPASPARLQAPAPPFSQQQGDALFKRVAGK